jgi:enoyl-CoA hydratase/carnithine racemase
MFPADQCFAGRHAAGAQVDQWLEVKNTPTNTGHDVIIAERGAKFGFPENIFGLFPGMGAYSLVARRVGAAFAEEMMLGGRIYTAEEMKDVGLVHPSRDRASPKRANTSSAASAATLATARSIRSDARSIHFRSPSLTVSSRFGLTLACNCATATSR